MKGLCCQDPKANLEERAHGKGPEPHRATLSPPRKELGCCLVWGKGQLEMRKKGVYTLWGIHCNVHSCRGQGLGLCKVSMPTVQMGCVDIHRLPLDGPCCSELLRTSSPLPSAATPAAPASPPTSPMCCIKGEMNY